MPDYCPRCGAPRPPDTITGKVPRHGQPEDIFARMTRMTAIGSWYGEEHDPALGWEAIPARPGWNGHDDEAALELADAAMEKALSLDPLSPYPPRVEVADMLLGRIGDRDLTGTLPPAREIAAYYRVSPSTAGRALRMLAALGVIEPLPGRRGYRVPDALYDTPRPPRRTAHPRGIHQDGRSRPPAAPRPPRPCGRRLRRRQLAHP